MYTYLNMTIDRLQDVYPMLTNEGIGISSFHRSIIDKISHEDGFILDVLKFNDLAESDEDKGFLMRVQEQIDSRVEIENWHGVEMDSDRIMLLNILFEDIVKSREMKQEIKNDEIIEKIGGQLIPQFCDVTKRRKRQQEMLKQYRESQNIGKNVGVQEREE